MIPTFTVKNNGDFYRYKCHIALINKKDQNHQRARDYYFENLSSGLILVSTNFVICETLNFLRSRISLQTAIKFRNSAYSSSVLEITYVTHDIEEEAFAIFKKYTDKDFSFTDCTSFATMKHLNLNAAFTFDKHFKHIGFEMFPA